MSARINGTTNTNNNINIENNIKLVSLGRGDSNLINLLEAKANLASPTFTGTVTLPNTTNIGNVTSTELSYLSGVTSGIQTKLLDLSNNKANSSNPIFTGTLIISNISANNISVSGDIANVIQIIPQIVSDISTSLGTSTNNWQRAFIHDLSGITSINGTSWSLISSGGGTSDFSGTDISTSLIPTTTNFIDLGTPSIYWRNAYIHDLSITNISISGNMSISGNLEPLNNITSDLGSSSKYWHNAYIDNIDVSSHIRIGQGHFGGKILSTSTEHELIIDPYGFDFPYTGNDASGRVVILGDLIVRGDTTTINSASIDISDLILNIASNATRNNVFGTESGIELGSDKYASLLYNRVSNSWKTNIGLEISGAITLSGNLVSLSNSSQLGSSNNYWSNAYITNLNVTNFVNTIDASYLTDNTITSAKIANGTIINNDISSNAQILFSKIDATNAIMNSDISTNANIAFSKIDASLAITNSHIATNADISGSKIANASIASSKIDSSGTWRFLNISANFGNIRDLSVNNSMTISGNLIPLTSNNNSTLGSTTNYWRNAYITDLSVTNISVSGNFILNISGTTTNVNTRLSTIDSSFGIVNTRLSTIDSSFGIVNTRLSTIDSSFTTLLALRDLSVNNSMTISGNLIPLNFNNNSTLGSTTNLWRNAYIQDLSVANISVSGSFILNISGTTTNVNTRLVNIDSSFGNVNTRLNAIDSSFTTLLALRDLSVNNNMTISGNLIPLNFNNNSTLGSTTNLWRNAYIQDLSINNNISVSGNITIDVSSHIKFGHGTSFSSSNRIICHVS